MNSPICQLEVSPDFIEDTRCHNLKGHACPLRKKDLRTLCPSTTRLPNQNVRQSATGEQPGTAASSTSSVAPRYMLRLTCEFITKIGGALKGNTRTPCTLLSNSNGGGSYRENRRTNYTILIPLRGTILRELLSLDNAKGWNVFLA
ncbi:hypothetical protein CBL_02664 [Carabus blaptoides fortunei]